MFLGLATTSKQGYSAMRSKIKLLVLIRADEISVHLSPSVEYRLKHMVICSIFFGAVHL